MNGVVDLISIYCSVPCVVNVKLYCRVLYCTVLYCTVLYCTVICNLRDAFLFFCRIRIRSFLFHSSHFLFFSFLFSSMRYHCLVLSPLLSSCVCVCVCECVCVRGRDEISHIISITYLKERQVVYYAFLSSFLLLFFSSSYAIYCFYGIQYG